MIAYTKAIHSAPFRTVSKRKTGCGSLPAAPRRHSRSTGIRRLFHYLHQPGRCPVLDAIEKFLGRVVVQIGFALPGVAKAAPDCLMRVLEVHRSRRDAIPSITQPRNVADVIVVGNRLPQ